jgi:hypothetical protein
MDPIITILRKAGERAGVEKCRKEFKIPITKAPRQMKRQYGNITLRRSVVSARRSPINPGNTKEQIGRAAEITIIVIVVRVISKIFMTVDVRCHIFCLSSSVRYSVNTGTKELLSAPSPKSFRKRLGSIKAEKKQSAIDPAPNT